MKVLALIKERLWLQLALGLTLAGVVAVFVSAGATSPIASYADCVEAGNPVLDTNPPICRDGINNFTGTPTPTPKLRTPMTSVPFEILVDGDTQAATPPHAQTLINTQSDWQLYWRQVHVSLPALPPIISVDFASSSVVGVSLGRELTTGYGLKITNITTGSSGTAVNLTESTPTISCPVQQTISNRYLIVRTAKLAEPVSFHITSEKRHCP